MPGFRLTDQPIEPEKLKSSLRHQAAGALVTFEGWVRDHNEGRAVEQLAYEAFGPLAISEGNKIIGEAVIRFGVLEALCIHRTGLLQIGEPAVWVGVVAPHREAAYQASRYIIDNIKMRLPIWKKEFYVGGEAEWVNCQQCAGHAHSTQPVMAPAGTAPQGKHGSASGKQIKAYATNPRAAQQEALRQALQNPAPNQPQASSRPVAGVPIPAVPAAKPVITPSKHPVDAERYLRQTILPQLGIEGQGKLAQAKVLVVGAGGLGSAALQYLAAAGIGHLGICEYDPLEASNLNRQVLYATSEIGQPKAQLAAARLKAVNPRINIYLHSERLTKANAAKTISPYDLVLDCTDNFPTKFLINDTAVLLQKPVISASIYQYEGQIYMYRPTKTGCLRCLWPEAPRNGVLGNCDEAGVLGTVPGIFGTLQAMEALKFVLGLPTPLADSLLMMDLLTYDVRKLKREKSPTCQHGEDYLFERIGQAVERAIRNEKAVSAPVKPVPIQAVPVEESLVIPVQQVQTMETTFERWSEEMLTSPMSTSHEEIFERSAKMPQVPVNVPEPVSSVDDWELELLPWTPHRLANFTVLDIREAHERGRQKDRPLDTLQYEQLPYSRFNANTLNRDKAYLLLCQKGQYSAHLAAELRQLGYKNVYSLAGGIQRQGFEYLGEILNLQEGQKRGRK